MSNKQHLDIWNERLSFIWYNDNEIFDFTDKDFDDLARSYAQSGITIVITFSCTHFRYSFVNHWDKIFKCIKRLCDACHKYGIKVVEHASCNLTHNPKNEDDIEYVEDDFKSRNSTMKHWDGFLDFVTDDDAVMNNGRMVKEFRQIDGRTGEYTISNYRGYCFCYNNPLYRESYFKYLDELYKTGIDGVMADDIQYVAEGNSCACEYCRKLFKEETGYDLPYPDKWGEFFENYSDPAYVAWKRFKVRSTERYQRDINRHFESRGLKLLRPNYISSIVVSNWSSYPFEQASDLWDFTFQENCFSSIIRYSFYAFAVEAMQRYAMCEWKNNPSLSLFYPDRYDSFYFSWALSSTWGQILLATAEGSHNTDYEKEFRTFERKHSSLYRDPKKLCDMTFYHSTQTRDFTKSWHSMRRFYSAVQSAYMAGYSVGMVFDYSNDEVFFKHKTIVCPAVTMVSDEELKRFAKFVSTGGKLIILGEFAKFRADGSERKFSETLSYFGDSFSDVIYMPNYDSIEGYHDRGIDRMRTPDAKVYMDFSSKNRIKERGIKLFGAVCGDKTVSSSDTENDLLLGAFRIKDGYTVNITNITDCIPDGVALVSHHDTIPAFVKGAKKIDAFSVNLKCDEKIRFAYIVSPEFEGAVALDFEEKDGYVKINIPGGYFSGYGIVHLIRE